MDHRYNDLNSYLRGIYGCRVQKITIDAGLNCPNRDGSISYGGCIYCNARGSGTGAHARGMSITQQIVAGKAKLSKRYPHCDLENYLFLAWIPSSRKHIDKEDFILFGSLIMSEHIYDVYLRVS